MEVSIWGGGGGKRDMMTHDKVEFALSVSLLSSKPINLPSRTFVDIAGNGEYLWQVNFKLKHEH